jgi:hypothetical protein
MPLLAAERASFLITSLFRYGVAFVPSYSIEARSLDLPGPYSHNFWVLRDQDGKALAELHGLATDRETGKTVPIGTDEKLHSLRVRHFPLDADYAQSLGVSQSRGGYIAEGQDSKTVLVADEKEVMARWNSAVAAKAPLNALDRDYPSYGFKVFGDTINSNSTYRTLGEIMGVPVHEFSGVMEPGIDNRMTSQKQIEELRTHGYPVLDEPSVKRNGQYESLEPRPMPSPGPSPSPIDDARAHYDPRTPGHPGHADFARIREGLADSIRDPRALDNATASAYREMIANPLVKEVDYVGVHNGNAIIAYAPYGLGREPMFSAHTDLAQAQRQPAEDSLDRAQALAEARASVQTQEQASQSQGQGGPALSIGARSA